MTEKKNRRAPCQCNYEAWHMPRKVWLCCIFCEVSGVPGKTGNFVPDGDASSGCGERSHGFHCRCVRPTPEAVLTSMWHAVIITIM